MARRGVAARTQAPAGIEVASAEMRDQHAAVRRGIEQRAQSGASAAGAAAGQGVRNGESPDGVRPAAGRRDDGRV